MSRLAIRHTLAPLSVLLLAGGLTPPPTVAPDHPEVPASLVEVAASGAQATPAVVQSSGLTPSGEPTGEAIDLYPSQGADPEPVAEDPAGDLRAMVEAEGTVPVIVRLREQADLTEVAREAERAGQAAAALARSSPLTASPQAAWNAERAARGRVVVTALQATAEDTQDSVRALLGRQASEVREFWVFNGFAAVVDETTLDALAAHPDVASITLDEAITLPEPETGDPLLPEWSLESVNAPATWGDYGVRGAGVVIGVMDSGVDGGHPALASAWRGIDGEVDASWFVPTGEDYPQPGDGTGHGTHVTGSIVGAPPGEVTGVAPEAQWIAAKIFRDSGSSTDSIVHAGFEWMLAPGGDPAAAPDVVNNSWGTADSNQDQFWDDVAAWEAAGIVPIFANGNEGPAAATVNSPASYPHAIGVGATHADDRIAAFSSRGPVVWDGVTYPKPDLSAPGHAVRSTWPREFGEGDYRVLSGTSMAAPHVTGVVALLRSAVPGISVEEVRAALAETARVEPHMDPAPSNRYGAGIVDAYAAVTWAAHAGIVTGAVTGPGGQPVEADVTVGDVSTTTDAATGGYALRVPPGGYELTARAYGFHTHTGELTVTAGAVSTVDVTLAAAAERQFSGTVTGPDGPVPHARVVVAGTPLPAAHTDQAGGFAMSVPEGRYDLRVFAAGFAPAVVAVSVDGPTEVAVSLDPLAGPADPGWSQYQNNPARTGLSGDRLAAPALVPSWTASAGAVSFASPVLADRRVYIGSNAGRLSAFDTATGDLLWRFEASAQVRGAPAVAGGIVYTGGGVDGGIYALDAATGEQRWAVPTPGRPTVNTAPVVTGGVVYAATGAGSELPDLVLALDAATGEQLWSAEIGPGVFGVAASDGLVVAASSTDRRLVALDAATGEQLWSLQRADDDIVAAPSIAGGTVFATTTGPVLYQVSIDGAPFSIRAGSLLAVDAATGELRWENPTHLDGQGTTPAVYHDLVIAGSHAGGKVVAYHRDTGEPVWHYNVDGIVSASVLVSGDGYVFGASQLEQRLWALDAGTGELVWEEAVPRTVTASAAYADGRLVTVDAGGTVRAYHPAGSLSGTVTGPDGPVAATVRAVEAGAAVETDPATGAFALTDLVPGMHTVEVREYGFAPFTRTVEVIAGRAGMVDIVLSTVGAGTLSGTVRDEAGQPLPGTSITLSPTPFEPVITGEDGGYAFGEVAAGTYQLVADAPGYERVEETITVSGGDTAVVDFTLAGFDIAVVSDFEGYVTAGLTDAGWRVDRVSFDEIAGTTDRYAAVVVAGSTEDPADADLERLSQLVAEADQTGTSLVFLGQWSLAHNAVRALSLATGDPAAVERSDISERGRVWMEDPVAHPITASLPPGEQVTLSQNLPLAWFSGYTGYSLARVGTDLTGALGGGIGYQRRTMDSNHVLLPVHSPAPSARPDTHGWEQVMWDVLVDAVSHAASAEYGEISGQVTDASGTPLAATVEVVDGVGRTMSSEDGRYRLLLDPGEQTLRFRFPGAETVEQQVSVVAGATQTLDVPLPDARLGTVLGTVTDAGSGAPLAGATVSLPGLPVATTGPDGRYLIERVPGGSHDVAFAAEGYREQVIEDVTVAEGDVTTLDAALATVPPVVVLGDRNGEITNFLNVRSIPAVEAGWEVTDDLGEVRVVVVNHPPDPGRDAFLSALDAFDEAGVSVVFLAEGLATRTRGIDLLVRYTGDPPSFGGIGGSTGPPIYLHNLADHPLFDGVEGDPVPLLTGSSEAGFFPEYSGVTLAEIAEEGAPEVAGIGMAYNPRTPDSVHLLLGGLTATFRNSPIGNWTADGQRIFLNAMRWAAAPGMSGFAGTVTDPAGEPVASATVEVTGTSWQATTGADGGFEIAVPPGEHTLRYQAFGYATAERTLTVGPDQVVDASAALAVGDVGTIGGVVSSSAGGPLAGVRVELRGSPYQTVTGADGSYTLPAVEPGGYELELETGGHVRTVVPVEVTAGGTTVQDVALRVSPLVGIVDDSDSANSRDRTKEFLADWGYQVEDVGFEDLDRLGALDLVVANVSDFALELDIARFQAFEEAVNRAGVPVLWMGQHERGAIRFLHEHDGDPAVIGQGFGDGTVTATVVEDHPLVAGLPDEFPLIAPEGRYTYFDDFGGTTVATLATGDGGEMGATVAYRGRTAGTVDVLLSTLAISTWGAPSTRQSPAVGWTPEAERLYLNAVAWALDAQGIGAEVRGTVQSELGGPVASRVEVVETGRSYAGRDGDGTFLVPLQPGSWTLTVSAFAHQSKTVEVTVEAGQSLALPVTLTALPSGTMTGTVTGPDGSAIAGANLSLLDTPLAASTGAGGDYTITGVPGGDWTLRVSADGFRAAQVPVTVTDGQATVADVQLVASAAVAIVDNTGSSTNGIALAELLTAEGYQTELVPRTDLAELAGRVGDYDLIIFNSTFINASQRAAFGQTADAAAAAGVSTIFAGQYGDYATHQLAAQRGDPESVTNTNVTVGIDLVPQAAHPIFAGFPAGEPIELITSDETNLNQRLSYYSGYSGRTIATVHARVDGVALGDSVGYRFSSPTSVELLLSTLGAASTDGYPGRRWTEDAERIYLNAVAWAIDATQSELAGVVTGGGQPLGGATVTALETGATAVTAADGSYVLGLVEGTHTIRVSAFGFAPAERTVEMPASGTVTLDVDLARLPRGEVAGAVTSLDGGAPVAGAMVSGTGPVSWTATTGPDGRYAAGDLLPGEYEVTVTADGHLPATGTVTVVAGQAATLDVALQPTTVGVLGDVEGALTAYLVAAGVPAAELAWDAGLDLSEYEVVVVNGGDPDAATFDAVLAAADAAEVSLVFTGTWAVDRGGIRLLERHTDRVTVGTQGYGDGPVQLTGFDPSHPLFAGLGGDPATLIVEGGYYSVLDSYAGAPLAGLSVDVDGGEPVTGLAAGYDWRTNGSVEVLLSASAVTEAVGPGLGWTADGGELVLNAIAWARDAKLEAPAAPTLTADAPVVVDETVAVSGEASWPSQVTVLRRGTPVATADVAADGTWSAEVPLRVGDNKLTAVSTNPAGTSPASARVTVARWVPEWEVRGHWPVQVVTLHLDGPSKWTKPADRAELVIYDADGTEVARRKLTWVHGFYLHTLRGLPRGEYTLRAELVVDGYLLVIDGPMLS